MTNAIHADEKQSREGLLFGLDRGRAACPLDCLRKRGERVLLVQRVQRGWCGA